MRKISSIALVLVLLSAGALLAQNTQQSQPAMSAQQKAMMDAAMRAATPGPAHKRLNAMVGTFDAKVKYWPAPNAPAIESSGTSTNEWILGGRWIQQRFEGSMMGAPFSGLGYTGYDNLRHMYVGTWMDSMSTQFMTSSGGDPDPSGKTWNFTASMMDPMSGESVSAEEKMTVIDNDHQVWEMYGPGPDGRNYKMMEITYTRRK